MKRKLVGVVAATLLTLGLVSASPASADSNVPLTIWHGPTQCTFNVSWWQTLDGQQAWAKYDATPWGGPGIVCSGYPNPATFLSQVDLAVSYNQWPYFSAYSYGVYSGYSTGYAAGPANGAYVTGACVRFRTHAGTQSAWVCEDGVV